MIGQHVGRVVDAVIDGDESRVDAPRLGQGVGQALIFLLQDVLVRVGELRDDGVHLEQADVEVPDPGQQLLPAGGHLLGRLAEAVRAEPEPEAHPERLRPLGQGLQAGREPRQGSWP